jgi:creatine kinase
MIRPGLALPMGANPPRRLGVLASDPDCYDVYRELLDPIIREYHGIRSTGGGDGNGNGEEEDGGGGFEEWSDPELPMESHFLRRKAMGVVAGGPPSSTSLSSSGGRLVGDDGHEYGGVLKSGNVADDDADDVDGVVDDDDDVALPIGRSIASEGRRRSILRRHPTIINNPRLLVTNKRADPDGKYVISTRIRVARSIGGYRFPSSMSRSDRREVMRLVGRCVSEARGPVLSNGSYVPLLSMTIERNLDLIRRHVLFDNPNEWTIASGLGRDWPDGRAVYANVPDLANDDVGTGGGAGPGSGGGGMSMPDFMIWVNEEDHLRMMCLRSGGDIQGVFATLTNGVRELEREMRMRGHHFVHDTRLGYLTSCPTNVGTGMRASVHVRLTNLGKRPGFFDLIERLKLEVRGKYGETDRHYTGVFDVSNLERLGKSEVHLINVMVEGVAKLIELERRLEAGEEVDIDAVV